MASFVVHDLELLARGGAHDVQWGWYPMAPWPGRLRGNACTVDGRRQVFPATFQGWTIHGTVPDRSWDVVARTASAVELATSLGGRWPWPGRAVLTWALDDDSVRTTLRVESGGPAFPAEVGWHPVVRAPAGPRGSGDPRPAGAGHGRAGAGPPADRPAGPAHPRPHDDAFVVPSGQATLTWPGALSLRCTSDCTWFVVFDELPDTVCVEPQTAAPDALNGAVGGPPFVVRPGRPRTATATWRWRMA